MKQKFIINDKQLDLDLTFMHMSNLLIEVTCLEDSWRNYISSGLRYIEIEGTQSNGKKFAGKFQIIDKVEDVYVLKTIQE